MSSSISFPIPEPGIWTITGEFAGQIVTQQINITDKGATVPVSLVFSSSTITVTSPVGTSLLLTDGTNQLTAVSTGTNTFTIYNMGQWTVSGTLEGYTLNTVTVNVVAGQNYPVELSIQTATLTVTAPASTVVTVTGGGDTQEITATSGTAVFQLTALGSYQVSGTLNGLNSNTVTVDVTAYQPYTATLTIQSATIVVTTLDGVEVTAQNGGTTLTAVASDGQTTFQTQTFGNWTISGTLSGYTFSPQTVDVQAYQQYDVSLKPLVATITVTAPAGTEIAAENSTGQQVQGYADNGTAVLEIYSLDTWTVSGNQNGLVTNVVPVQVSDWTDYPVTLTIWAATITVTTPTGTLVTAQNGATQIQGTASNNQVIFAVQLTGDWFVSAQFDDQTDSETVNVQAEEDYPIRLWVPTIVPTVATGSVVTCTQGQTVLTKTSQSGKVRFYVPALGEWTLNATLNEQSSNTVIVDVQEDRDYPLLLNYTFATITVATVEGTEITAQNGAIIITQTADSNGEAVFEVATFGTWTVSADFDGELVTADVVVSEAINYDVEIQRPINFPVYYGAATSLSVPRQGMASSTISDFCIFAGGYNGERQSVVDVYNAQLTKVSATSLSVARSSLTACSISGYALFVGGGTSSGVSNAVDAYDEYLTKTAPSPLNYPRSSLASAKVSEYGLFGGGYDPNGRYYPNQYLAYVESYDLFLTRSTISALSKARASLGGAQNGNYAFFAGGTYGSTRILDVDAYDSTLTKKSAHKLAVGCSSMGQAQVSNYAIFSGGFGYLNPYASPGLNLSYAYGPEMTRSTLENLPTTIVEPGGASSASFAVFGGGYHYSAPGTNAPISNVTSYDENLSMAICQNLSSERKYVSGASVGQFILFAGGRTTTYSDTVDAYTAN